MVTRAHAEHALSDRFMAYVLSRNIRIEEDLIDQLFNSSEKRLAANAFVAARYARKPTRTDAPEKWSQDLLAEMISTTRSRVNSL